ncbi:MAG TPA: hypothetical protein VE684_14960 [Crenalkalicoccus sp.]|jgi:hypothetical protein|nr:hypothetical protein [Crenalkalicoccus sp.]
MLDGKTIVRVSKSPPAAPPLVLSNIHSFAQWTREGKLVLQESGTATMSRDLLIGLLRPMLERVAFDANWYRAQYPDLARAEAEGVIQDVREHYIEFGFFENRLPCFVEVDAAFYGREYPDVAAGIAKGVVRSAQWHFEAFGFREGRLPRRGWRFADLIGAA